MTQDFINGAKSRSENHLCEHYRSEQWRSGWHAMDDHMRHFLTNSQRMFQDLMTIKQQRGTAVCRAIA